MNISLSNQALNAEARLMRTMFDALPGGPIVLRLLADYKGPDGKDYHRAFLVPVPRNWTTEELVKCVQHNLAPGQTLTAVTSLDYMRPIYVTPGFLEETFQERGLPVPDDMQAAQSGTSGLSVL